MKTLVVGWFSFKEGHATAGDLLAGELVCDWLDRFSCPYNIAVDPPFGGGINWRLTNPKDYSHVVFVCGPFQQGELEAQFFTHFTGCHIMGLDLTMLVPLDQWNPFDFLIERDSSVSAHPDITFLSPRKLVPIVGICLVEPYETGLTEVANAAIHRLISSREISIVEIDTRLDTNITGLRTPAEIESLLARMDVVITTRLHGTVLALKNGVPTISIDPEAGGAKIVRQAETIGWPVVFVGDSLTDAELQKAFDYCLTEEAKEKVKECCERATRMVEEIGDEFIKELERSSKTFSSNASSRRLNNHHISRISVDSALYPIQESQKVRGNRQGLLKSMAKLMLPSSLRAWFKFQLLG